MIPLLEKLFKEIEHGDQEHRDWLKNKMEEFSSSIPNIEEETLALINLKIELLKTLVQGDKDAKFQDSVFMVSGDKSWTRREMYDEISKSTKEGREVMIKLINLSADLLSRGKEKV